MHSDVATLSKPSIWREASRIVYEEGFRAFWKGNLVTIAHRLPYSSISFYTYERYKHVSLKIRWTFLSANRSVQFAASIVHFNNNFRLIFDLSVTAVISWTR